MSKMVGTVRSIIKNYVYVRKCMYRSCILIRMGVNGHFQHFGEVILVHNFQGERYARGNKCRYLMFHDCERQICWIKHDLPSQELQEYSQCECFTHVHKTARLERIPNHTCITETIFNYSFEIEVIVWNSTILCDQIAVSSFISPVVHLPP